MVVSKGVGVSVSVVICVRICLLVVVFMVVVTHGSVHRSECASSDAYAMRK